MRLLLTIFIIIFFQQSLFGQIYVKWDASGSNRGTSWNNAYKNLSEALEEAFRTGEEVWVARGIYSPDRYTNDGSNNIIFPLPGTEESRESTFYLTGHIQLYGGFNGGETNRNQRDPELNKTILSGDIERNDSKIIADTLTDIVGINARHVMSIYACTEGSIVDGFILTSGHATHEEKELGIYSPYRSGAAITVSYSRIQFVNIIFSGNFAERYGAAIYVSENYSIANPQDYPITIIKSRFINNQAKSGAAIYVHRSEGELLVSECIFEENKSISDGGAVYINITTRDNKFYKCDFIKNVSYEGRAAALLSANTFEGIRFDSCNFVGNKSYKQCSTLSLSHNNEISGSFIKNSKFLDNSITSSELGKRTIQTDNSYFNYENLFIVGNSGGLTASTDLSALGLGAAILKNVVFANNLEINLEITDLHCELNNCTIAGKDTSAYSSGVYLMGSAGGSATLNILNSIIWGFNDNYSFIKTTNAGQPNIQNSIIQKSGSLSTIGYISSNPLFRNVNNIEGEDGIFGTNDDGLFLTSCSPAINSGSVTHNNSLDIANNSRPFNNGVPDIGAYEYQGNPINSHIRLYVQRETTGLKDGSSWENAFDDLDDALQKSQECNWVNEIWVSNHVYYPKRSILGELTPEDNRLKTFLLRDNLKIYGGFIGTESNVNQRIQTNKTILSGDIDKNDINIDGNSIIENYTEINGENSYHVLTAANCNDISIDGFIITGGKADKNTFTNLNNAFIFHSQGGGAFFWDTKTELSNIFFIGNYGLNGGGLAIRMSEVHISSSVFEGNQAYGNGGGLLIYEKKANLTGVIFNNNRSNHNGGGAYLSQMDSLTINNTVFYNSHSASGGGIMVEYIPNTKINNSNFVNNSNAEGFSGDGAYFSYSNAVVKNSIFYGNSNSFSPGYYSGGGYVSFKNSIFQNNLAPHGNGNLNKSPQFLNIASVKGLDNEYFTLDDGLTLTKCSPAVNKGENISELTHDILKNNRVFDFISDIGSYESSFLTSMLVITSSNNLPSELFNINTIIVRSAQVLNRLEVSSSKSILLEPGFSSKTGATFEAKIERCPEN
jgi:hypothetical protein